jgi:hypothetical protein
MPNKPLTYWIVLLSLMAHGAVLVWLATQQSHKATEPETDVLMIAVQPTEAVPETNSEPEAIKNTTPATAESVPNEPKRPFMDAPPAPSAAEWAQASTYTLKNSKRYRYTWGQQVRSMMGTAFEGPDQGVVRFQIEIAPDGTLTRLETLWSTSPKAEELARKAIASILDQPLKHLGMSFVFLWRGMWGVSPIDFYVVKAHHDLIVAELGLLSFYAMAFVFLVMAWVKRRLSMIMLSLLALGGVSFYAGLSHFLPRYMLPFYPVFVLLALRQFKSMGSVFYHRLRAWRQG